MAVLEGGPGPTAGLAPPLALVTSQGDMAQKLERKENRGISNFQSP